MPPLRTTKKNQSAASSNSLFAYGFHGSADRVTKFEACGMLAGPSVDVSSPTTATTQVVPAPTSAIPKTERAKPLGRGESNAAFQDDRDDWDKGYHLKIGTSTRKITLGSGFALTK